MTDPAANGLQPWQRPPFQPGHELSKVHGANSPRSVGALAEAFFTRLMSLESTPGYLQDPSYEDAIMAYCRACAIVKLLWDWADKQDIETAMTDLTTEDEEETRSYAKDAGDERGSKRKTARRSTSRHVSSVLEQLHKHETRAIKLRASLGLDPLARMKMQRDVAGAKFDLAQAIAALGEAERGA